MCCQKISAMVTNSSFATKPPSTMTSKTRPQSRLKAFTIIESLVVLAILAVLTMVLAALYLHHVKPSEPSEDATPISSTAPAKTPEVSPTE